MKQFWPLIVLVLYFSLFYFTYINLHNSDIGRHITNGRQIFSGSQQEFFSLLHTNFYSFSETNRSNINHHWFFGIIAYVIEQTGGFSGLTVFNVFANTAAFSLILVTALQAVHKKNHSVSKIGLYLVTVIGFLVHPLITQRLEVRPESVSLLLFAFYNYVLNTKLVYKQKWLLLLLFALQIVWVNSHLFFILGPLLVGYYLFQEILQLVFEKQKILEITKNKTVRLLGTLFFGLVVASLINPFFMEGLLTPLTIFNNYAYRVAENQSTFFMISYGSKVFYYSYVVGLSTISLVLFFYSLFKNKKIVGQKIYGKKVAQLILLFIFIFLANKVNRMTPFLAVIIVPLLVETIYNAVQDFIEKHKTKLNNTVTTLLLSTVSCILLFLVLFSGIFTPHIPNIGAGLIPNTFASAEFFKQNSIKGPIFNNYDIGGYLAYTLFPQEKLFIDNRPEAYSENFLQNEFLAALNNESKWEELENKYQFNAIYFYRLDQIDGAQNFLYERVRDESWVPVYVDQFVLLFVKNSQNNQSVIKTYELPKEMFGMTSL